MKKILYVLLIVVAGCVASCYDDKSTEVGMSITEVSIESESDTLYAIYGREFVFSPNIHKGNDTTNLSYLWQIKVLAGYSGDDMVDIGENAELVWEVTSEPSANPYLLLLTVTDNEEGLSYYKKYELFVSSEFGEGLLVAYTNDGGNSSDLAFVSSPEVSYDYEGDASYSYDLYSLMNEGAKIEGRVNYVVANLANNGGTYNTNRILVGTDRHLLALDATTFDLTMMEDELFLFAPDNVNVEALGNCQNCYAYVVIDGMLYYQLCQNAYQFGSAANYNSASTQVFNGNIAEDKAGTSQTGMLVSGYDEVNGHFMYAGFMTFAANMAPTTLSGGDGFDASNVPGKESLKAGRGNNGVHWHLLRDVNTQLDTLYELGNCSSGSLGGMRKLGVSNCTNIANAVDYAFCENTDIMYYATQNRVYPVLISGTTAVTGTPWELPSSGEVITAIKMYQQGWYGVGANREDSYAFISPEHNRQLLVTTYNSSTGEGKIYVVPITALGSGTLGATTQVFEGFGEITAIGATLR